MFLNSNVSIFEEFSVQKFFLKKKINKKSAKSSHYISTILSEKADEQQILQDHLFKFQLVQHVGTYKSFTPFFTAVYIVNLCTKQENSSILGCNIRGS